MTFENFAMLLVLAFVLLSSTFGQSTFGIDIEQWETVTSSGDGNEQEERVTVTPPGDVIQCACNYTDFEDNILSLQGLLACTYIVLFVLFF